MDALCHYVKCARIQLVTRAPGATRFKFYQISILFVHSMYYRLFQGILIHT